MNRIAVALVASSLAWLSPGMASADNGSGAFDWVWQTVNQNFYTDTFNGVDWNAMQTKYRDRASRATTREQRAVVINEMLAELHTSHTAFYTPDTPEYYHLLGLFLPMNPWLAKATASALTDGKASYAGIGIFTQTVNGQQFVRGVHDGLPAHKAGIQLGDRLVSVDGAPFHPIRSFQGKAGQSVIVVVERTPGASRTLTVVPAMLDGSTMFVDAMAASTQVVARDGRNIGYIHAWSYAGQQYQDILEGALLFGALKDADALVLDVRDGLGGASPSNLNIFTRRCLAWTAISRSGAQNTLGSCWAKPVVLLTDNRSTSGKELMAYAFKRGRVGSIVGARTAGAVMAGTIFANEADASLLYLATKDVRMDDGARIEGQGVQPDIDVPFQLPYAQGQDARRERALDEAVRLSKQKD
ncbi:S41 family peptidase [Peristeroidobacter soli]|jgi:carboxyl-terminal processing protease|uniref:S41 family peptidase n=1 Tax=Peristeroidobacter soli TaxID=2497877 RepID=UPI001C376340|nr:S41 family peptidase [Peristeroidobacter soli]